MKDLGSIMGAVSLRDVGLGPCGPAVNSWVGSRKLHGCFVGRYSTGAHRAAHIDLANGQKHTRLVCMLQRADAGGQLLVAGSYAPLDVLDAVEFRADLDQHEVTLVEAGERIVLTVGVVEPPDSTT